MEYEKWDELLAPYDHAVEELKVKFKNIRKEFLAKGEYSPIEFVTGRTKKVGSIISKATRLNVSDIETEIEDIAGIRIMCQFVDDIYTIVDLIKNRSDMTVVSEKDYIENFKDSGYRSFHVIIKYPINSIAGSKEILCEIQIRTLAMNFWATIEHSLKYKYEHYIPEEIAVRLRRAADAAFLLDQEMSEIREDIMKAQVMYQVKSVTVRDVLNRIQELYSLGDTRKAIIYQRRLDKIDTERDVTEILSLKKDIDDLLEQYKRTGKDDRDSYSY
ncbi:GTP pyrophosphokinase [Asaccharospora irregularis]|uniref:Putative GTP pyrophosphokinase n=1 Tax=Asaccharospora irregularis DSM 2635 TaxID=1121321 RepID=A0A1M5QXU4_9FIRM|nr:GTP pyrophosphokinase family protein [Asaccharospora irregularis]SHH18964.1 putative GTP pyrophosphokinase [Asaccharospora irregularis DSM 2635]